MVPLFLKCQVEISPLSPRAPISVQELIIPNSLRWMLLANQLSWGQNTSLKGYLQKKRKAQRLSLPTIRQVWILILSTKRPYYPSPAIFVYTLPNICLGEIAIRHGLRTESSFFIFDQYPSEFFSQYSQFLLQAGKAKKVLCAWVELMAEDYCLTINIME